MNIITILEQLAQITPYNPDRKKLINSLPNKLRHIIKTNDAESLKKHISNKECIAHELDVVRINFEHSN